MIHNEPNGLNINVDCGSTHIESLQKYVAENNLDIGFAFDGDADRCFAVDEKGNVVDGDQIMYICACKMKEEGTLLKDTVVATVMSNYGMEKCLGKEGIRLLRTPVGDKYVSMEIMKNGYSIGGEQSGHIIFSKYSTTGDGILTAIKLMETVVEKKTMLSFLTAPITLYPQILVNKRVQDADALLEIPEVKAVMKEAEKDMGEKGRLLLRKSGTEPLLRILVEAESEDLCQKEMDKILACVDSFLPAE